MPCRFARRAGGSQRGPASTTISFAACRPVSDLSATTLHRVWQPGFARFRCTCVPRTFRWVLQLNRERQGNFPLYTGVFQTPKEAISHRQTIDTMAIVPSRQKAASFTTDQVTDKLTTSNTRVGWRTRQTACDGFDLLPQPAMDDILVATPMPDQIHGKATGIQGYGTGLQVAHQAQA